MGQIRAIKKNQDKIQGKRIKTAKESFQEGFTTGYKQGYSEGAKVVGYQFIKLVETLQTIDGIGPKRFAEIIKHFERLDREQREKGKQ